jgi:hypothetical protein
LIGAWLPDGAHSNLLLRVAVREIEAWLLADIQGLAAFLGLKRLQTQDVESLTDPKTSLLAEVKKSRRRRLREDILPARRTSAKVGPRYNGALIEFVRGQWQPEEARRNSDSLDRMIKAIDRFHQSPNRPCPDSPSSPSG